MTPPAERRTCEYLQRSANLQFPSSVKNLHTVLYEPDDDRREEGRWSLLLPEEERPPPPPADDDRPPPPPPVLTDVTDGAPLPPLSLEETSAEEGTLLSDVRLTRPEPPPPLVLPLVLSVSESAGTTPSPPRGESLSLEDLRARRARWLF